ncbi:MAG: MFS transporter [Planctomycetes bacterium]|nr:MFS transporter [Planctomycetota bacterium]
MNELKQDEGRWYDGITRYQWLVFVIACLGWVFDVFEGQIFAVFKTPAMADLLGVAENDPLVDWFGNAGFASFLIGGAFGGLLFGILADRIGRRQSMVWSILTYSAFTGLHYFAQGPWQIVALRFFVAMGVAGEWAIAASLVAEVFPKKARAMAGGLFHASSVLGAVFAAGIGMVLDKATDWRPAFLVGLLPALLVVWVLVSIKESEKWTAATAAGGDDSKPKPKGGSLRELLGAGPWRKRALIGLGLASIGLGTYWGIYAWGPELVRELLRPTRTVAFWQTENAEELIVSLNDGPSDTELADWLAKTCPNLYGANAGSNDLSGRTNEQVAAFYQSLGKPDGGASPGEGPPPADAQVLAVALAAYVTSENLAGTVAAEHDFLVSEEGMGMAEFNVGKNGAVFGVADKADMTILDALLATDKPTTRGLLHQLDADDDVGNREETAGVLAGEAYASVMNQESRSAASFAYLIMNFTGGFAGLVLFAPITMLTNRRIAFAFYHIGAVIVVPITFLGCQAYWHTLALLPVTAFFVVGMHAGYAIYFPELFPTRLRATGASFCFNVGRFVSALMLLVRAQLRDMLGLRMAVTVMASLFLVGLILLLFAPETKDEELPE